MEASGEKRGVSVGRKSIGEERNKNGSVEREERKNNNESELEE